MKDIILVLALSLDAFVASMAYGTNNIRIPFLSIIIINIVCSSFLALALFIGSQVKRFIPQDFASILSFLILFLLGIYYLLESMVKSYLNSKINKIEKVKIKLFNIYLIVNIYMDTIKADFNDSKSLDSKEALYLATALSLDSLSVGFGSSLGNINYIPVILLTLLMGIISIKVGLYMGKKIIEKININLSWLSGLLLILLGILKLLV